MTLTVEVWSDLACPWCYVGRRRLEEAVRRFDGEIELRRRAFELDPQAPESVGDDFSYVERLRRKYGASTVQAEGMIRTMTEAGAAEGLELRFDLARPGNTLHAHRLIRLAGEHEVDHAMEERLFRAYLTEGVSIGMRDELERLAAEVGLPGAEVTELLEGSRFTAEVREDEAQARALGVSGVPFFHIEGREGLGGAQPAETLLQAFQAASRS